MSFDIISYVAGLLTIPIVTFVTYHTTRIVELRAREKEQWETVRSQSSVSEDYWKNQVEPQTFDDGGLIAIRHPSPKQRGF